MSHSTVPSTLREDLLCNRGPSDTAYNLAASDGLVGDMVFDRSWFVTSPNSNDIFYPPSLPHAWIPLSRREDTRYGQYDYTRYPQYLNKKSLHLPCIPCRPTHPDHPYFADKIVWCSFDSPANKIDWTTSPHRQPLGRMPDSICDELQASINRQRLRLDEAAVSQKMRNAGTASLIDEEFMLVKLHLDQLRTCTLERSQMQEHFHEVQRAWLTLTGFFDFVTTYQPRLVKVQHTPHMPTASHLVGAFVLDTESAYHLSKAGIPCWLLRPLVEFNATKILTLSLAKDWRDLHIQDGCADPPYPTIDTVMAGSDEFYDAFLRAAKRPFQSLHTSTPLSQPPIYITDPKRNVYRRALKPTSRRQSLAPYNKIVTFHGFNASAERSLALAPIPDKLKVPLSGPFAPEPLEAWKEAVSSLIATESRRHKLAEESTGYCLPNPFAFVGVQRDKANIYLHQWDRVRESWIVRLMVQCDKNARYGGGAWRHFLFIAHLGVQSISHKGTRALLNVMTDACEKQGITPLESSVTTPFPQLRGQWLLWELAELNFRLELLQLDEALVPPIVVPDGTHPNDFRKAYDERSRQRQELACRCFDYGGENEPNYLTTKRSLACSGLASTEWSKRYPYVKALWELMDSWIFYKPREWRRGIDENLDAIRGLAWEREIAWCYTQNYYDQFARPPVLPYTLRRETLSTALPAV